MPVFGSTRAITGTDTPVQGTDDGAFLTVTGNCVVTLNATGWVAGRSAIAFEVTGAASLTFTEGAGVTIRAANSDETVDVQYQSCVATYTAANTWTVHKGVDPADFLAAANNLSDVASAATARTNLGVAIGSDVQAHSAVLDATTASFTTADETKLDGIADGSDVGDMLASTYDAAGHASQVLTEADTQTVTNKTINDFSNSVDADAVHEQVRNESGGTLTAGTPVYASGYSVGQELVLVDAADATSVSTMPVLGLVEADISNNATGAIVESGLVKNIDTSSWSVGDVLFVSETAGTLTTTKPTGTALVEEVAEVLRSHATLGIVEVIIAPVPYVTGFAATLLDDGSQGAAQTTLGVDPAGTDNAPSASATTAGKVELATIAEVDTGTDTTRAITPAGLAGSALQTKVDGIETGATADQTGAQIKAAYEAEADTNAYDDAAVSKLAGIEAAADVTDATNVAAAGAPIITSGAGAPSSTPSAVGDIYVDTTGDIGWVATGTASSADWKQATGAGGGDLLAANNLSDVANAATSLTNLGVTAAAQTVTDDVTVAAMVDTLGGASSTGTGGLVRATSPALVTPDLGTPSALVATNATGTAAGLTVGATTGVEAGADVTDATNVAAAGAHMAGGTDVPVTDGGTGASTAAAARTNLDVDQAGTDNAPSASATTAGKVELATIAEVDTGTDTTRAITPAGLAGSALQTKVDGIEAGATADQTTEEIQDIAGPLVATGGTKTGVTVTYQDATGDMDFAVDTASTTVAGIAELATAAETSTGTDATRAVTPDGLAGSDFGTKSVCIVPHISTEACAAANGTIGFVVPAAMAGMDLTDCVASVHTAGTTGTMSVMVRRRRATTDADMLSTALTIDSAETSSTTAATAHAINGANDDLNEGDTIYVDIDGIHTTPATGLSVTLSFGVA